METVSFEFWAKVTQLRDCTWHVEERRVTTDGIAFLLGREMAEAKLLADRLGKWRSNFKDGK